MMFENGTINNSTDFWTFIGLFIVAGAAFFGAVWAGIKKIMKR